MYFSLFLVSTLFASAQSARHSLLRVGNPATRAVAAPTHSAHNQQQQRDLLSDENFSAALRGLFGNGYGPSTGLSLSFSMAPGAQLSFSMQDVGLSFSMPPDTPTTPTPPTTIYTQDSNDGTAVEEGETSTDTPVTTASSATTTVSEDSSTTEEETAGGGTGGEDIQADTTTSTSTSTSSTQSRAPEGEPTTNPDSTDDERWTAGAKAGLGIGILGAAAVGLTVAAVAKKRQASDASQGSDADIESAAGSL